MKKLVLILSVFFVVACEDNENFIPAKDAQEAAREFVRASLDGNYEKAAFYTYKDPEKANQMLLEKWKKDYDKLPNEKKTGYLQANIQVKGSEQLNDSTASFTYSNSFTKEEQTLKIVRVDSVWVVDLKDIH